MSDVFFVSSAPQLTHKSENEISSQQMKQSNNRMWKVIAALSLIPLAYCTTAFITAALKINCEDVQNALAECKSKHGWSRDTRRAVLLSCSAEGQALSECESVVRVPAFGMLVSMLIGGYAIERIISKNERPALKLSPLTPLSPRELSGLAGDLHNLHDLELNLHN